MKGLIASAEDAACLVVGHAAPAQALITRVWVSASIGADNPSCGGVTTPCRTFQYVHDAIVAAGGEIDILDPGGYGPVTIGKSLAIVNDGVGVAGSPAGTNGAAITIAAGPKDSIYLRGLTLNGFGAGEYGVLLTGGGNLTIANCTFRQFALEGVSISPASGATAVSISNSIASDNTFAGVSLDGANAAIAAVISQTTMSNNGRFGLLVQDGASVTVTESIALNNSNAGFEAATSATLRLSRSVATGNSVGVTNYVGGATVQSYGDNRIDGNTTDVFGTMTTIATK